MKVRLTKKECQFLGAVVFKPSGFNFDELDFTKSWNEQRFEDSECWQTLYDYDDYKLLSKMGFSKKSAAGVIASLNKKKLLHSFIEKRERWIGPDLNWLYVDEENFNNINETVFGRKTK